MKKLILFFFLLTSFLSFAQDEEEKLINHKLDSLNIDYKSQIQPYVEYKETITDFFNLLILNGDYSLPLLKRFVVNLNLKQKYVVFSPNMTSEKKAIEIKDAILRSLDLRILAEKHGLAGRELKRLAELEDEKNLKRVLDFLRETNFSPAEFNKLSNDQKLKMITDFEKRK